MNIDILSASRHKFNAQKGIGILYIIRKGIKSWFLFIHVVVRRREIEGRNF